MKEQNQTPVSYTGKHVFTQSEKDAKLQQMLNAMRLKQEIEDELKTTKSTYKAKIDSKEAEIKLMQNLLMAGAEDRVYQTILTMDFTDGKKFYHEVGTNNLVGTEDLTAADRQMQMALDQKNIKANNKLADELQLDVESKLTEAGFTIVPVDSLPEGMVEQDDEPEPFEEEIPIGEEVEIGNSSLAEHLSADDYDDPFSGIGSRDNALDIGHDDDDSDPFDFSI